MKHSPSTDGPPLRERMVAVLGGSSGIGLAIAQLVVEAGAKVLLLGRDRGKLDTAVASLGSAASSYPCDMRDVESVAEAFRATTSIDHFVATAATDEAAQRAPFPCYPPEKLERALDKLRGFVTTTQVAAALIPPDGSITLFSGASAVSPPKVGMAVLAAANASIIGLGKALARELAPIRVNVIMPGVVDTGVWGPADGDQRQQLVAWAESSLPARHLGKPAEVAALAVLAMTNPFITGAVLVADGGLTGAT